MKLACVLALALALVSSSGCYYAFGTKPSREAIAARRCTSARALPIADAVIAAYGAGGVALGGFVLAHRDDGSLGAGEAKAYAAMLLAGGAVMLVANGLSAYAGFRDVGTCRAAAEHADLATR